MVGSISMVMSWIFTLVGIRLFCRPVGRWLLCKIFVLSGCSCKPTLLASALRSPIIAVMWDSDVDTRSMSSAKRKFVSRLVCGLRGCKGTPCRLLAHLCFTFRIMLSDTQLNSRELNGSPCLVPRSMLKSLLRQSVLTAAVWLRYSLSSKKMYDGAMPCSAKAVQIASCETESKAFLKSTAANHNGICHSSAVSCRIEVVKR